MRGLREVPADTEQYETPDSERLNVSAHLDLLKDTIDLTTDLFRLL